METVKCLIINFNRLILTKAMVDWCWSNNLCPIIIDNHSSYRPLLQYYNTIPCQVIFLHKNFGHKVIWEYNVLDKLGITGQYIVTDPDLDLSGIPDDFLDVLREGLNKYKKAQKCGFSLDISNLPEGEVKEWEKSLWQHPLDEMYFKAPIDTTFALYRADIRHHSVDDCIRTNKPYTAVHVPWGYRLDKINKLPKDEQYYIRTASSSASIKTNILKK